MSQKERTQPSEVEKNYSEPTLDIIASIRKLKEVSPAVFDEYFIDLSQNSTESIPVWIQRKAVNILDQQAPVYQAEIGDHTAWNTDIFLSSLYAYGVAKKQARFDITHDFQTVKNRAHISHSDAELLHRAIMYSYEHGLEEYEHQYSVDSMGLIVLPWYDDDPQFWEEVLGITHDHAHQAMVAWYKVHEAGLAFVSQVHDGRNSERHHDLCRYLIENSKEKGISLAENFSLLGGHEGTHSFFDHFILHLLDLEEELYSAIHEGFSGACFGTDHQGDLKHTQLSLALGFKEFIDCVYLKEESDLCLQDLVTVFYINSRKFYHHLYMTYLDLGLSRVDLMESILLSAYDIATDTDSVHWSAQRRSRRFFEKLLERSSERFGSLSKSISDTYKYERELAHTYDSDVGNSQFVYETIATDDPLYHKVASTYAAVLSILNQDRIDCSSKLIKIHNNASLCSVFIQITLGENDSNAPITSFLIEIERQSEQQTILDIWKFQDYLCNVHLASGYMLLRDQMRETFTQKYNASTFGINATSVLKHQFSYITRLLPQLEKIISESQHEIVLN